MCRAGAGGWGSRGGQGGYMEIFKTGANTYMAVCMGWGVYVCTVRG